MSDTPAATSGPPRREILAFIALADAPMPVAVDFDWGNTPAICLEFDTLADAQPWEQITGVKLRCDSFPSYSSGQWRGWKTWLTVKAGPSSGPPLDDETQARLAEIEAQGGEPR